MLTNNNGNDPATNVIESVYASLSPKSQFVFEKICARVNTNLRERRPSRKIGLGEIGTRELVGKLAIYLALKSEQSDDDEDIWENLLG